MIDFNTIKVMLITTGISGLKIEFDDKQKQIVAHYIFRGVPGIKRISYQEITDSLVIGIPEVRACPTIEIEQ